MAHEHRPWKLPVPVLTHVPKAPPAEKGRGKARCFRGATAVRTTHIRVLQGLGTGCAAHVVGGDAPATHTDGDTAVLRTEVTSPKPHSSGDPLPLRGPLGSCPLSQSAGREPPSMLPALPSSLITLLLSFQLPAPRPVLTESTSPQRWTPAPARRRCPLPTMPTSPSRPLAGPGVKQQLCLRLRACAWPGRPSSALVWYPLPHATHL